MSEPVSLSSAVAAARKESLWDKAPGWRNLTIAASFLTLAAAALPALLPQPEADTLTPQSAQVKHVAAAAPISPNIPLPIAPAPSAPHPVSPVHIAALPRHGLARTPIFATEPTATPNIATGAAPACALPQTPTAPLLNGVGTVVGFEDPTLAQANIQVTEARSGGKIDPDYIQNQRVMVQRPNGQVRVFILPKNMAVQIGDRVTLENGYRNMALPCNYVPVQIASDIGPAPTPTQAPQ